MSHKLKRKEAGTVPESRSFGCGIPEPGKGSSGRAFLCVRQAASLTVEAALVLPVFLFCMLSVCTFLNVYSTGYRFSCALAQTAEEMAIGSYTQKYGGPPLLHTALSAAYARKKVLSEAGNRQSVRNENLLLSDFSGEDGRIRLALTYRVNPIGTGTIPGVFFLQQSAARAWTGREGSGGESGNSPEETEHQTVFITEYASVYHTDINCTHIKLKIEHVARGEAAVRRNRYGEKYHACELCGKAAGDDVYITTDGNRYHSSLSCAGLKRSVKAVELHEAGELRPCSKCAGGS